jgi:hypothetical protein
MAIDYELHNMKFVQKIDKYPCIYNYKQSEYSRMTLLITFISQCADKYHLTNTEVSITVFINRKRMFGYKIFHFKTIIGRQLKDN